MLTAESTSVEETMRSLEEIKQRLAAIEQHHADVAIWITALEADVNVLKGVGQELLTGQGVLCERLDRLHEGLGGLLQNTQVQVQNNHSMVCERLDALAGQVTQLTVSCAALNANHKGLKQGIEEIKGGLLHQQFKSGKQKVRRRGK